MPEADTSSKDKQYHPEIPQQMKPFPLKGAGSYDWGMKNRLARTFDPETGRTVMLAVDHGYFQGPTTGLERIDLSILPLVPYCDALFCTRGILRSLVPPQNTKPMVLRASGGRVAVDRPRVLAVGNRSDDGLRGPGAGEPQAAVQHENVGVAATDGGTNQPMAGTRQRKGSFVQDRVAGA